MPNSNEAQSTTSHEINTITSERLTESDAMLTNPNMQENGLIKFWFSVQYRIYPKITYQKAVNHSPMSIDLDTFN